MKKLVSIAVLSFLVVSGAALAQQSGDQEKGSSMHGMMGQMMQGEKSSEGGMGDMKGMMKMMRRRLTKKSAISRLLITLKST